jgi:imidazole glycerol-phosphate synthase subunit HisH
VIAVIDYGAGNLRSVTNALLKLGCHPTVTSNPDVVLKADAVIFPGVGAAKDVMSSLNKSKLDNAIREFIGTGKPFLGVCIGMQVLLSSTEEDGGHACLGIVPGKVKRLPQGMKVPHMGWNQVKQKISHPIFNGIPDNENFYFVHSYYAKPDDESVQIGATEYGVNICSVLNKGNLIATQFHPERSDNYGLMFYGNFLKMAGIVTD